VELLPEGLSFDYSQPADGLTKEKSSPLAVALFGFEFVRRVFITSNFITVTKGEATLWEDELFGIKQYLKKYFEEKISASIYMEIPSFELFQTLITTIDNLKIYTKQ
jgi:hypothetical protein